MKFPFLSRNNSAPSSAKSLWPWPSCHQPRTLSFRNISTLGAETPESCFSTSDDKWPSFSCTSSDDIIAGEGPCSASVEALIRSLRSERLIFKPAGETKSIVECPAKCDESLLQSSPFKESVILSMESKDPFGDFKKSMEEMLESQCLKGWNDLEQLLTWYLKVNGKSNHGYILGAFIDLLVGLAFAAGKPSVLPPSDDHLEASSSSSSSSSSAVSHPAIVSVSPSSRLSFYTYSNSWEEFDDNCSVSLSVSSLAKVAEKIASDGDDEGDVTTVSSTSSSF